MRSIGAMVSHDDLLLLQEGGDGRGLTDEEVRGACLMRGLPVTNSVSMEEQRMALANHLSMIAKIRDLRPDEKLVGMLTLHLSPLRYDLKGGVNT